MPFRRSLVLLLPWLFAACLSTSAMAGSVSGDLKKWHRVTVDFVGPLHNEMDSNPNPFVDYRLQVNFTAPSGAIYNVPGFFDGDGDGGATGSVWRVHFAPDEAGTWSYAASFRSGSEVAVSLNASAGSPHSFDGDSGDFTVSGLDSNAEGFLRFGRLESIGQYYFKFRDGDYWIKGGMDSPENPLGYEGFDNTPYARHDFIPHIQDWQPDDPDWDSTNTPGVPEDGRGIIGMLNYLSSQNLNSIYFMPMNIGADGKDTWPYASETINREGSSSNDNKHFDISKLKQWAVTLDHAQRKEIFLHFVLSDREDTNKNELDNATLGVERKVFYRELIARFGHHNALQWNISEEYNLDLPLDPDVIKEFAGYINDVDPYGHPVTVHNHGNTYINALAPFVGDSRFGVMSVQTWQRPDDISFAIEHFRDETLAAGQIVPTAVDESIGLNQIPNDDYRKRAIWDAMLSGGGHELFVQNQDSNLDNFRTYENVYEYLWYARKFVQENLPFWEMTPSDGLVTGESSIHGGAEVFAKSGEVYAIYLPSTDLTGAISLGGATGEFEKRWYNPRTGDFVGVPELFQAQSSIPLGSPPSEPGQDWAILIQSTASAGGAGPFQQGSGSEGLLSVEAENYQSKLAQGGADWAQVVPGGQSGAAAMQALPNAGVNNSSGYSAISPRMDYEIEFTQTGIHYVWVRGIGASASDDSVHVGLDGNEVATAEAIESFGPSWGWSNSTGAGPDAVVNVATTGAHTLNVWMREDGFVIDKIVLTVDAGLDPAVAYGPEGPPESSRAQPTLPEPVISPAGGPYLNSVTVSMASSVAGASIYYTVDGSAPTASSNLYSGAFELTTDTSVQAIAVLGGYNDSPTAAESYTITSPGAVAGVHFQSAAGDGLVSIEAETYQATVPRGLHSWSIAVPGGHSGAAAMEATPNIGSNIGGSYASVSPRLDYEVEFAETGTHYVWIRGIGPSGFDDSLHVGLDGVEVSTASAISFFSTTPSWSGTTLAGAMARLDVATTGQHTLNLWMREDGFIVDKIVLTTDVGLIPDVVYGPDGPPASPFGQAALPPPVIDPAGGTFFGSVQVTISATPGASIYYTTDGSLPTTSSNLYGGPFDVTLDTTVQALASNGGGDDSLVASADFVITTDLVPPTISPAGGSFLNSVQITMSTTVPGGSVYYTTDGSLPTTSSMLYGGPFDQTSDATVRAISALSGFADSAPAEETYTITTAGGGAGVFFQSTSGDGLVSIEAENYQDTVSQGAHDWTLTVPGGQSGAAAMEATPNVGSLVNSNYTTNSPRLDFEVQFAETGTHYVWIRGLGISGTDDSLHVGLDGLEVTTADRISSFGSSFGWSNVTMDSGAIARIDVATTGVHTLNLWMREDGFIVDKIVLTTDSGYDPSAVAGGDGPPQSAFGPAALLPPVIDPAGGTFFGSVQVTISATPGASIYYTTDGSLPTTSSNLYGGPFDVTLDTTVQALASNGGGDDSLVASADFVITTDLVPPTISPAGGSFLNSVQITMSTTVPGGSVYYTTDGSLPTTSSMLYGGPFDQTSDATVRAISALSGFADSAPAEETYTITTAGGGAGVFFQSTSGDGLVSIEAENYQDTVSQGAHDWTLTVPGGQSGAAAMEATPNVGSLVNSNYTTNSPRLDFEVQFAETGTHYVWIRGLGISGTDDSLHVGLDGLEVTTADRISSFGSSFGWSNVTMDSGAIARIDVATTGVHTLNLWMREDGFIVDKIVLTTDSGYDPSAVAGGDGPPQSAFGPAALLPPVIDPAGGTFFGSVQVTISATPGASIYYTTDGSLPTTSSNLYGGPFDVTLDTTVQALASNGGGDDSLVASADFVITTDLVPPTISPAGGSFLNSVQITMSTTVPGGSVYYTTDGSLPTTSSMLYGGPFDQTSDATVRAISALSGFADSAPAEETYTITTAGGGAGMFIQSTSGDGLVSIEAESYQAETPRGGQAWSLVVPGGQSGAAAMEAGPNNGAGYYSNYASTSPQLDFEIEFAETGTHYVWIRGIGPSNYDDSLHVGLDGVAATSASAITFFAPSLSWSDTTLAGPVATIDVTTAGAHTLNLWMREDGFVVDKIVLTTGSGYDPSAVAGGAGPAESPFLPAGLSAPIISPPGGTYFGSVPVTITAAAGTTIHYTTDGSPATISSPVYGGQFTLTTDTTVQAIAAQAGGATSPVASAGFTISSTLVPPTISPAGGAYLNSVTVSMTTAVQGGSIYYTTDGSLPTMSSNLYDGPFDLTLDVTVRAISALSGFTDSAPAEETYTITTGGGGSGAFVQSSLGNGLVSMEAENYQGEIAQGGHAWSLVVPGGQSGTGSMEATPNIGTSNISNYVSNSPRMDYEVQFTETGTHYIWIRGIGASGLDDSLHVGLDGVGVSSAAAITYFSSSLSWSKTTLAGPVATIDVTTAGVHTLNLWMREDGFVVDKIVLTTDSGYDPSTVAGGEGPPESPLGSAAPPPPVISPAGGTFLTSLTVSLSSTSPGAVIRYTTDGSDPNLGSPLYTAPFVVSADTTVKAIAIRNGTDVSAIATELFSQTACQNVRIMPLGDSITDGKDAAGLPPASERVGYRRGLFFSLTEDGHNVDFVGSVDDGYAAVPVFDADSQSHPGASASFIAANVYGYLVANPADYILLHIGTNVVSPDVSAVETILDEIDRFDPAAHVVLAKIINRQVYSAVTTTFNQNLEAMALARSGAGDLITIVDMESALDYPGDLTDNLHPNVAGYAKMADEWFNALTPVLPGCVAP